MIFVDENNNPLIMKLFVYALHAYIYLHKKFDTILIILNWLINLSGLNAFYGLIKILK